jgi:signal transduction histidine kinase
MNCVDIAWPMLSGVGLTLGLIHALGWANDRRYSEQLALALICFAITAGTLCEFALLRTTSPERYGSVLRWTQVFVTLICVGIVWFVHVRYRPGRAWLGALVIATRVAGLVPDFLAGANVNFRTITSLDFVSLGASGPLAVPIGEPNPWMALMSVNAVLLVAYLVNAMVVVRRRGEPVTWRHALITCGSLLFFVIAASVWNRAIVSGWLHAPMLIMPAFAGTMLVMTLDVSAAMRERRRAERELALQGEQLTHLSRVAVLSELTGSLSHEISQPLTAILSNAQAALRFLGRSPPNVEEVHESLTQIIENDQRAAEVIRRLRAMLRRERIDRQAIDANDVVLDVVRLARSNLASRNVTLSLDLANDLPRIEADRVQLQQVVLNLVVNALDAAGTTPGTLRIRTARAGETDIDVFVADDGCGIGADDTERIFSPFVTTKPDGLGLGLAVCASIIHSHGGTIRAENNAARGATVTFRLPVAGSATPGRVET